MATSDHIEQLASDLEESSARYMRLRLAFAEVVRRGHADVILTADDVSDGIVASAATLERKCRRWGFTAFDRSAVVEAFCWRSRHSLTFSETKFLAYLLSETDVRAEAVERAESPDFVVADTVGVEVKSNENYSMSLRQLHSVPEYHQWYVYLSAENECRLLDSVDWIGLNEYERPFGE